MIRFLFLGLIRDKSRSVVPILVVAVGVMLSVFVHAYITGFMNDSIEMNARFSNGHVKVVTKAYADNISQMPIDLALLETGKLKTKLQKTFPGMTFVERIQFGGLIDVPDENGETKAQGPVMGMALDIIQNNSGEIQRLNLAKSVVQGRLPQQANEILISDLFAQKLEVEPGDRVTFIGSTMYGAMSYYNFVVSGTVSFGATVLDQGSIIVDIHDARKVFDMQDAASEILGFFGQGYYSDSEGIKTREKFREEFPVDADDEFAPAMMLFRDQGTMGSFVDLTGSMGAIITFIFIVAMSLVLWNAGLLGGLRRYGEIGVRLAMGEPKGHVYRTMLYESVMIGIMGSILGTAIGLFFAWLMQKYGLDIGSKMKGTAIMMPSVLKARITTVDYYIGFIPGLISTLIGTALAGIGIYKRKTSQLFKELDA
jgi:putative ABC transport system permease protein